MQGKRVVLDMRQVLVCKQVSVRVCTLALVLGGTLQGQLVCKLAYMVLVCKLVLLLVCKLVVVVVVQRLLLGEVEGQRLLVVEVEGHRGLLGEVQVQV